MSCNCCQGQLNSGMLIKKDQTEAEYKSCPRCSQTNGSEHVFHRYPDEFGFTQARVSPNNPNGHQSHCADCRALDKELPSANHVNGVLCRNV